MWKHILLISSISTLLIAYFINTDCFVDLFLPSFPDIDSNKIWTDNEILENEEIRSIVIKVPDHILVTLNNKIKSVILPRSTLGFNFQYGFNVEYLKKFLVHWMEKYSWHVWEAKINTFPHFFTTIDGLQLHFIHIRPKPKEGQKLVPILLLHGWPGSFFEFYKLIPMLLNTTDDDKIVYEIICPSLPGYGWSDEPTKSGFGVIAMSNVLFKLMDRLKISEKFYVQGGDWGSLIANIMTKINSSRIAGIHVNMINQPIDDIRFWIKLGVGAILPSEIHFLSKQDQDIMYPFKKKLMTTLGQMGYFWIQSTKPSTVGIALSDSPVGLAAYILEKFGAWSNDLNYHLNSENGGLEDMNITKDEMLTNVMIYYITNTISSSIRLYKEFFNEDDINLMKYPVTAPVGIVSFPKEIVRCPRYFAQLYYRNIRQFTEMPRGGHFGALEEPGLLVEDLKMFINEIEGSSKK